MKRISKYLPSLVGIGSILLFCVNATADITSSASIAVGQSIPESLNMFLLGIGLIGLRSFMKIRMADR